MRVRVDRWRDVAPLEHGVNETGELQGIGCEDGTAVTLDHAGVVGQVPKPVRVDHDRNVLEKKSEHVFLILA